MNDTPRSSPRPNAQGGRSPTEAAGRTRLDKGRWSSRRKTEIVLRVLKGEALAAMQAGLQSREPDHRGEGYRKIWARLLHQLGIRTASRRVLRIIREHDLLAPTRAGVPRGPVDHDGTIVTERPDQTWASWRRLWATGCLTAEGNATVFVLIDHCTGECLGAHAARRGTRFKAIECFRQAIWATRGHYEIGIAAGTSLRHDHGSQFISHGFQEELKATGIESSPSFIRQPEGNGCPSQRSAIHPNPQGAAPVDTALRVHRAAQPRPTRVHPAIQRTLDPRKTRLPNTRTAPTQPAGAGCVNTTLTLSQKPDPLHASPAADLPPFSGPAL